MRDRTVSFLTFADSTISYRKNRGLSKESPVRLTFLLAIIFSPQREIQLREEKLIRVDKS